MRLVLIGNPNSPRTVDFHASMASKFPSLMLKVVPWANLIQGKSDLRDIVREQWESILPAALGDCPEIEK